MKLCNRFFRIRDRFEARHVCVERVPLQSFERVCLIIGSLIFVLLGCVDSGTNDDLRRWHIEAIGVQKHISRALAYYEVAATSVGYDRADVSLCGPETLDRVLLPVEEKLSTLAASIPTSAGDVQNTLADVGKLLDMFRRKSVSRWNEAATATDLRPEDYCLHAGEIVPIRADIEDLLEQALVLTTPR